MCSACGFPLRPGHWTDAGASTPMDRLRNRFARVKAINVLLAPHKFRVYDDGVTSALQLLGASGQHILVENLEQLWATLETILGYPIDPLIEAAVPLSDQ